MSNNLQIIRERLFKGYNDRLAPEFLPAGYLADALNCFIRTGEIVKRNGYTIIGNDLGANACQGLKGVRFADGTQRIYTVVKVTSGNVLSTVAAIPIGTIGVWFHNAMHVTGVSGLPNRLR